MSWKYGPRFGLTCNRCGGVVGNYHKPDCMFAHPNRNRWRPVSAVLTTERLENGQRKPSQLGIDVMSDLADGKSVKAIAYERGLSKIKVQSFVAMLHKEYGISSNTALVAKAFREGWIK